MMSSTSVFKCQKFIFDHRLRAERWIGRERAPCWYSMRPAVLSPFFLVCDANERQPIALLLCTGSGSIFWVRRCFRDPLFPSVLTWNTGWSRRSLGSRVCTTAAHRRTETWTCGATPGGRFPSWSESTVSGSPLLAPWPFGSDHLQNKY